MLVKLSALAALALAAHVAAEPAPYKPQLMKTSLRDLFRRDDTPGYQPTAAVCGTGATCAEACGAGYETCASSDEQVHCFNPGAAEICCPNGSGNSCDAGYYCTVDKEDETWCCPNGMDVVACAAAYSIAGGLVSQTAKPTTSSSWAPKITPAKNSTVSSWPADSTSCSSTVAPSGGWGGANITATAPGGGAGGAGFTPSPTPTKIQTGAGSAATPAGAFALVLAGIAALL
ncbi:hypothetical protein QBC47DRAFT_405372 [Echria macrotheca]|uniref:Uncharacterized protein n=1 Tax=Echria macrotheca TaxID=438768 RepID=A0AAJ0B6M0_9PEZI|nr:hypothetical protein QBC47DRAFT_405372 [Echria macrotheca]